MSRSYGHLGNIYFVQEGERGPVKIGFTENAPEKRMMALQCGNSRKLFLLRHFVAEKAYERIIHRRFHEYKIHGEWFAPCQAVLHMTLDDVASGNTDFDRYLLYTTRHANGQDIGVPQTGVDIVRKGLAPFSDSAVARIDELEASVLRSAA